MKITYTNVQPLLEGFKQIARVVLLGVIPIIISGIDTKTGAIEINWRVIFASSFVITLTAILSGLDKELHLAGKLEGNTSKTKGLTRF
jgi:hypothetical protein